MAQIVKLRRSSVSGQKPTNTNLQLGELALNTTDGKVFFAKSGSLGPTVEELVSTNTVNTGSIHLTGDVTASNFTGSFKGDGSQVYNVPVSGVTNLTTISGSIDNRLDVLEAYSSSQQVPTSSFSERTLQIDVYCKNISGVQINKGQVVRVYDSVGDNPLIRLADNSVEQNSANTLGIATQNIPNDSFGMVITAGILIGVNTNGMTAGDIIYLSTNGSYTTVKPIAPIHGVRLGQVIRPHQTVGSILVRVDNGIELDEAHDVTYTNISQGDLLVRNGNGVWNNSKQLYGDYTITGSLTVTQNLTVLGSSSLVYVTSSNLAVSASFISVNVFEPAERFGGLKVYDSGSSNATASLAWDSQHNHWVYQNVSGTQYSGGMLLSGPRNSGSLGDEPGLIDGRIVKSIGGDHLDVSIISETGSTITIDGTLVADSITGSFDFFGLINRPTLVSGSSQIDITGTTGYSTFSSSVKDSIDIVTSSITDLSSSVAITTNNLDGRLDSIEGVTGSYATTGSNQFNGDQSISGSVNIGSGSLDITSPEVLHVGNSGSYNIARFDGYDNNYAQINVKNHHSGSGASTDFVLTADNGTENIHYVDLGINSSNYNAGYVGRENDAYLLNAGKDLYVGTIGGSGHPSNLNLFAQNKWETPQIHVSGSGQVGFNTLIIASGYTYEFSGSIKANNDLNIVGDVSASVFTGSFSGDGSGLYNIPASGVTGIELNKIVSGSVSASISPDNGLQINTDVFIDGTLTAKELHIDYVTSSVLYQSGSTKFGDTSDDVHSFTGSVNISGSINVESITGSIDFTNLTNLPTLVSESSQISYTGITDVPLGIVSGSQQISYTGITDIPLGIVSSSSQVIDLGFVTTSSFETFTGSYNTHSESFDSRINLITGSIDSLNTFSSSVVLTSETASMSVLTSSYALTASYALNAGGGGTEGRTAKLDQTTPSLTWIFNHNLGEQYPTVTIYDGNDDVIIPQTISADSENTLTITFPSAQVGHAVATVGGGLPFISSSFDGYVLAADSNTPIWKGGIISSSLQVKNFGFATTGSNTFTDNQTINGTLTITNALIQQITTNSLNSNTTITSFSTGSYDGGFFDYVIKSGTNLRAGTVTSVWTTGNIEFNEVTTNDLGDTSNVDMVVTLANGKANLNANISSGIWTIKVLSRGL